jgi:predicted DNA-binding transcriptional regulator AlpA
VVSSSCAGYEDSGTSYSTPAPMKTTRESARFLSTKELSELLGIPEGTLRQWRCSEVGPKWHKLRGSVRYDKSDVENFLHESERIPSVRAHMEEHLVSVSSQR